MEWIKQIIKKHTDADGKINLEEAVKEINSEFPKNAVPKDQYNNVSEQLKTANQTLTDLQESTKDNPDIQKQLQEANAAKESAEKALNELKVTTKAKEKLLDSGVKDPDYAIFKMGSLELDKDGELKDFDAKFEKFKTDYPAYVEVKNDGKETKEKETGFKTIDNKLDKGNGSNDPKPQTLRGAIEQAMTEQSNQ